MTKKKTVRVRNIITQERVDKWTDEEVLTNLHIILGRANITTDYVTEVIDEDSDPVLVAEVMCISCGDKAVFSEPRQLDWPLQLMPIPESLRHTVN